VSDAAAEEYAISLHDLAFQYDASTALVVDISSWQVAMGEHVFLYGPSGSGKSTLLGLLAGLQVPTRGAVSILGEELSGLSARQRDRFRAQRIGVVFQQFNLIPYLSVVDNVLLASHFGGIRQPSSRSKALDLLTRVNLDDSLHDRLAGELSIGQQQRVAIVRSLINSPQLLLVDEPTSALDDTNRDAFLALLFEVVQASGCAMVFVSHDPAIAASFERRDDIADLNHGATS
tara:strand:+ start:165 stop:860 length:696 start_codon:yes stop_codon:yes gene_type:complete